MARPTKADQGRARSCLVRAGVEVASAHLDEPDAQGSLIDFPVDRVLSRAGELWDGGARGGKGAFSRTTLVNHFGGVDAFRIEVLAQLHSVDLDHADHLTAFVRRVGDGLIPDSSLPMVREDFSRGDLDAMTEHPARTRQWLELHSRIREDQRYADIVRLVYRAYDARLAPPTERELERRGRRLRDGITVDDLLLALTALTEGTAVRVLADDQVELTRATDVVAAATEAIIIGLTEPLDS